MTTTTPPTVYEQQNPPAGTPEHMTGAELQTLREAAGLSREALAGLVGVEARTVKHWENGRSGVPADVAQVVANAAQQIANATAQKVDEMRFFFHMADLCGKEDQARKTKRKKYPAEGNGYLVLMRYKETAQMHPVEKDIGLTADMHGAMVTHLMQTLLAEGRFARVVWFDPDKFAIWAKFNDMVQNLGDTIVTRRRWAESQAIPTQAKPHPGDQPPRHGQH